MSIREREMEYRTFSYGVIFEVSFIPRLKAEFVEY